MQNNDEAIAVCQSVKKKKNILLAKDIDKHVFQSNDEAIAVCYTVSFHIQNCKPNSAFVG